MFTEYESGLLPWKISNFNPDSDANVLKHKPRELLYGFFDLNEGKFTKTVQLVY